MTGAAAIEMYHRGLRLDARLAGAAWPTLQTCDTSQPQWLGQDHAAARR